MAAGKTLIQNLLKDYKVLVIEKKSCPYCLLVRNVFSKYPVRKGQMYSLNIEGRPDCNDIQDYLEGVLTKKRTVPQIFISGKFIGGAKEVEILHKNGQLETILKYNSII